jgi:iron complex transport system ATP-binding protein
MSAEAFNMENKPIIQLQKLTVGYENNSVLSGITLNLWPGRLTCFMGPNGAGKSTLIKTICQFLPPVKGDIIIDNKSITTWNARDLAKILSVVLTDTLNAGQLTGKELVAAGRYPYTGWSGRLSDEDWSVVDNAMHKTGTTALSDIPFYKMSDGQRQKIMIARALCQETPLIILDEPTAHLDLNNRVAIVSLLRSLAHTENRAILMATHELDLALQMADELWLAETGGSITQGIPEDLVLDGSIDQVFKFKGYDLKTGSVHPQKTGRFVMLKGEGFLYLWTKNALERNGFEIVSDGAPLVEITYEDEERAWHFDNKTCHTIKSLLEVLGTYFKNLSS